MIHINNHISLADDDVTITFVRASGPGGQNVNKVATAAQLRFDAKNCSALTGAVRTRLERLAGSRWTTEGEIVIQADRFRTQEANKRDAIARLADLIRRAAIEPKPRIATQPSQGARRRRQENKARRAVTKKLRRSPPSGGDG